jgi:hypothetical protein
LILLSFIFSGISDSQLRAKTRNNILNLKLKRAVFENTDHQQAFLLDDIGHILLGAGVTAIIIIIILFTVWYWKR